MKMKFNQLKCNGQKARARTFRPSHDSQYFDLTQTSQRVIKSAIADKNWPK